MSHSILVAINVDCPHFFQVEHVRKICADAKLSEYCITSCLLITFDVQVVSFHRWFFSSCVRSPRGNQSDRFGRPTRFQSVKFLPPPPLSLYSSSLNGQIFAISWRYGLYIFQVRFSTFYHLHVERSDRGARHKAIYTHQKIKGSFRSFAVIFERKVTERWKSAWT